MKCWIHDDWPTSYHRQREDGLYDFVNKYKPACISPDFNDEAAEKAGWQQREEAHARKMCGMVDVSGNPDGRRCWVNKDCNDGYWRDKGEGWTEYVWVAKLKGNKNYSVKSREKNCFCQEKTEKAARDWCGLPPFGPRPEPEKPDKTNDTLPIKRKNPGPPDYAIAGGYIPQPFHRKPRCPKCHHKHKGYGKGTYVERFGLFGCVCRGCGAEFWVSPKVPSVVRREVALILACIAVPAVPVGIIVLVARWIA